MSNDTQDDAARPKMLDLSEIPTTALQAKLGVMMCNQMLFSYSPAAQVRVDALVAYIEAELKARSIEADIGGAR